MLVNEFEICVANVQCISWSFYYNCIFLFHCTDQNQYISYYNIQEKEKESKLLCKLPDSFLPCILCYNEYLIICKKQSTNELNKFQLLITNKIEESTVSFKYL